MAELFFIRVRGKVQGPFDIERLKTLAKRSRFSRSHEISEDGAQWSRASDFPELFPPPPEPKFRNRTDIPAVPPQTQKSEGANAAEPIDEQAIEERSANDAGSQYDQLWFYTYDAEQKGPVPFADLTLFISTGELTSEDYVWTDGMPDWIETHRVPGLFEPLPEGWDVDAAAASGAVSGCDSAGQPIASTKSSAMAVASLVLGLLGTNIFFFLGSILAVVFGHIALKQIQQSRNVVSGRGMAIAGLVLGYIVLIATSVVGVVLLLLQAE